MLIPLTTIGTNTHCNDTLQYKQSSLDFVDDNKRNIYLKSNPQNFNIALDIIYFIMCIVL